MDEQEMKSLYREITEAATGLERAVWDARSALENMEEFHACNTDPRVEFDWFIEHGFIPGATFKITQKDDKPPLIAKVISYTYHGGKCAGAAVVFEWNEAGKDKTSAIQRATIEKNISKFEKDRTLQEI